ncbi:MAG: hypothetical protein ACI4EN_00120 [Butyrivibrio sp.]
MTKRNKKIIISLFYFLFCIFFFACKNKNSVSLDNATLDKISALEKEYGITFNYCNVPLEEKVNLEYSLASDIGEIEEAVDAAEVILGRLPQRWAKDIMNPEVLLDLYPEIENVNIVLCDELEKEIDAYGNEIALGGEFVASDSTLYLMADIHNFEPKISLADTLVNRILNKAVYDEECREILFNREQNNNEEMSMTLFMYYKQCNPIGFAYYGKINEISDTDKKYVYREGLPTDGIYFVNDESLYSEYLDCRYIMGPLLYTDEDEKLPKAFESPHIQEKIRVTLDKFDYMFFYEEFYWHRWVK